MESCHVVDVDNEDEFAKLIRKMNPPRVVIDNDASDHATMIQVDSINKRGILLELVQVLNDLNLIVTKAYIISDGNWFMDVFSVTDRSGNKIMDKEIISCIQTSLESDVCFFPSATSSVGVKPSKEHTTIELTGTDRPGLLSEVFAILTDHKCNVVKAEVWTHNTRVAAVVHATDESTRSAIEDPERLSTIKELLCHVLEGQNDSRRAKTAFSVGGTHTERRLHQMMFDDGDYQRVGLAEEGDKKSCLQVSVMDCKEKDYTIIILRSRDRPKLLFDTICALTDMQYVVFHGTVSTGNTEAYQEYCIRHIDGKRVNSEAERDRLIQCLEAAIERRASEGLELELRTEDRVGLLSDITRIFRENGLSIRRAEISTEGGKAIDSFYVSETSGSHVDAKIIDSISRHIDQTILTVKQGTFPSKSKKTGITGFLLGSFLEGCSFQRFRLIRSQG